MFNNAQFMEVREGRNVSVIETTATKCRAKEVLVRKNNKKREKIRQKQAGRLQNPSPKKGRTKMQS